MPGYSQLGGLESPPEQLSYQGCAAGSSGGAKQKIKGR